MKNMFCEKCGVKMATKGIFCESCDNPAKKTLSWWTRISLPKKIIICFGIGFGAFQGLNFVIAYLMELTENISGT